MSKKTPTKRHHISGPDEILAAVETIADLRGEHLSTIWVELAKAELINRGLLKKEDEVTPETLRKALENRRRKRSA